MLLVQEYLKEKAFGDLAKEHGVYATFDKVGYKFSLNYDQIEARESDPLSQSCRGLVLATKDFRSLRKEAVKVNDRDNFDHICPGDTVVLAYPMKRFFNLGQGSAADINWHDQNLRVLEKLDGTLCIVYFDLLKKEWCVATRSVPDADIPLDSTKFTFRTLFEKAVQDSLNMSWQEFTSHLNMFYTYCFELTTPYNRVVVQYNDCRVTLLAVRDAELNQEVHLPNGLWENILPCVKSFPLNNVNEILDWVSSQNPMEYEGVVICDSKFNRIKVKNAAYVAFNKARDFLGSSDRNCLELVLTEKDDDVAAMLPPEIVENIQRLKRGVTQLMIQYDEAFKVLMAVLPENPTKRDFAINLQKTSYWQAPFFSMFDGKASNMKEFIQKNKKDGSWGNSFLDKLLDIINT